MKPYPPSRPPTFMELAAASAKKKPAKKKAMAKKK